MMNNTWKKALSVLIAVALTLSFAACAKKGADNVSAANATASDAGYSAEERAQVAVKVGDEYLITKGEIIDEYDYMVQTYSYYGMSAPTDEAEIESMQDSVIASLVSAKIQLYQTKQLGITLSDEQMADVESQIAETMAYYTDMFRSQAQDEGASDVEARTLEIFQEQIDAAGMEMSVDGFRSYMLEGFTEEAVKTALKAEVTKDVTATDEEIQRYYNDVLTSQKESYTSAPADYGYAAEDFQMNGGDPLLYTPEGYVRVRSISIAPSGEVSVDYAALKDELIALEAQYGAAALVALSDKYAAAGASASDTGINVTVGDIEGGADILSDYLTKKAAADALYENYTKDAREKANEAYAALEAGTAFTGVLAQYGEDTMYTDYPAFMETGLLMYVGGEDTTWNEELVKAVGLLKEGEYSAVILVDDVYYILQLVSSEPAGERTLTDVYDAIKAAVVAINADTVWNVQLEAWQNDTSIATYYEKVYRDIGKN
ncbi:MAG: peptidyl-prolyl cis-trans isomerase [Eubacteriales bacterium]|nr:peptidyl-prolyl cis-trans isomerase [Eubacteriales bacterium]